MPDAVGGYAKEYGYWIAAATQAGRTIDEDFPGGGYLSAPGGERVCATKDWSEGAMYLEIDMDGKNAREIGKKNEFMPTRTENPLFHFTRSDADTTNHIDIDPRQMGAPCQPRSWGISWKKSDIALPTVCVRSADRTRLSPASIISPRASCRTW